LELDAAQIVAAGYLNASVKKDQAILGTLIFPSGYIEWQTRN